MTWLRHSNTNLHLGVTVLPRCITTLLYYWLQSSDILPKWNWASSLSMSNSAFLQHFLNTLSMIFSNTPLSAWHVLNSVHFAKVNNVRELDFSCWGYIGFCVQFGQVHLGWQYNPPSEILRYRLHGYKLSSQVYGWRLKVSDSLRDVV